MTIAAGAAAFALVLGTLASIWLFARTLALLVIGLAIGQALAPVVAWLERWIPRVAAMLAVYLLLLTGLGLTDSSAV